MTTVELLKAARALIKQGWTRHDYQRDGRFCALGALQYAYFQSHTGGPYRKARDILRRLSGVRIIYFNDVIAKSKKDILDLYDRAIEEASNG